MIPVFKSAAEDLLNTSGLSPVELLAKALAKSIVSVVFLSLFMVMIRGDCFDLFIYNSVYSGCVFILNCSNQNYYLGK